MGLIAYEQSALPLSDSTHARADRIGRDKRSVARRPRPRPIASHLLAALEDATRVLFLDVETTGLSRHYHELTLVGWMIGGVHRVYVDGDDPHSLLSSLQTAAALVTFNGTLFDVPFLRKTFPEIEIPNVHADLRFLGRRAGLTGGQKAIEKELMISVRDGAEDIDGAQAVLLWHQYIRGDVHSLRRLIHYNRCDVMAMSYILDKVLERLVVDPDFWFRHSSFSQPHCISLGWAVPDCALPAPGRLDRRKNTFESLFTGTRAENATVVGIDLTGSEARPSGWCTLRGAIAETDMVATDDEIVARVVSASPALVSIDSPLSIPTGRTRTEDDDPGRAEFGIMRRCERELKRRGINVYPCLLPSMQALTRRGIRLAARLRRIGVPVIESYPGAAQDIVGIPRKGAGEAFLKEGLAGFGVSGAYLARQVRHDELDAITSALVGSFFLSGKYEALGTPAEDALIIPDVKALPGPIVVGFSGRICAGKTTASRFLEKHGFAYTRFSAAVDEEIRSLGQVPNRVTRQVVGLEINRVKGQRWLCERVLEKVGTSRLVAIDGMRFLEDRAFYVERFGSRFLHLHIEAPTRVRKERYRAESENGPLFEEADSQDVEREVEPLGKLSAELIENADTIETFERAVQHRVEAFMEKVRRECQSPLS